MDALRSKRAIVDTATVLVDLLTANYEQQFGGGVTVTGVLSEYLNGYSYVRTTPVLRLCTTHEEAQGEGAQADTWGVGGERVPVGLCSRTVRGPATRRMPGFIPRRR